MKSLVVLILVSVSLVGVRQVSGAGTLDRVTGWFEHGSNLVATATPDGAPTYSKFDGWSGDTNGASYPSSTQILFVVTGPRTVKASFSPQRTAQGSVPYQWMAAYTNAFEASVTNDWDNDGFTTLQEYWSGTSPTNAASLLRIASVLKSGGGVQLSWSHAQVDPSIPPIRLEYRANMATGTWQLASLIQPVNGTTNVLTGAPGVQGFYRLATTNVP